MDAAKQDQADKICSRAGWDGGLKNTLKRPLPLFGVSLVSTLALAWVGPSEATVGANVRLVYLHGTWVWAALIAFAASAVCGLMGLLRRAGRFQRWSRSLGLVGILFWVTSLPLSLATMQANWNGLYLSEPRWRIGVDFAVAGVLLQAGSQILAHDGWTSLLNALFFSTLVWRLVNAEQVMHPPSPVLNADSLAIRWFFLAMLALYLSAAYFLGKWIFLRSARPSPHRLGDRGQAGARLACKRGSNAAQLARRSTDSHGFYHD